MTTKTNPIRLAVYAGLIAGLLSISPQDVGAQETGTEPPLPGNGFTQMMSGLNPANWRMPEFKMPSFGGMLPTKDEQDRVIKKKNSFVDEVSSTAKKSWHRTKTTLNPKRLIPAGFKQNAQSKSAPKEPGFFSRLFAPYPPPAEVEKDPKSVTDWLKQDPVR